MWNTVVKRGAAASPRLVYTVSREIYGSSLIIRSSPSYVAAVWTEKSTTLKYERGFFEVLIR